MSENKKEIIENDDFVENEETENRIFTKENLKIALGVLIGILLLLAIIVPPVIKLFEGTGESAKEEKEFTLEIYDNNNEVQVFTFKEKLPTTKDYMDKLVKEGKLQYSCHITTTAIMLDEINGVKSDYQGDGTVWLYYLNGVKTDKDIGTVLVELGDTAMIKFSKVRKNFDENSMNVKEKS